MSDVFDLPMIRVVNRRPVPDQLSPFARPVPRVRKCSEAELFPHRALNSRYFAASNTIEATGSLSWWEWLASLFMKE